MGQPSNARRGSPQMRLLLASSSLAALLIGCGAPAWAACTAVPSGGYSGPYPVSGLCVTSDIGSGNITVGASDSISSSGIAFTNGTMAGSIMNSGTIVGGIRLDHASAIAASHTAISVAGSTFTGGISNAGAISAGGSGIFINDVSNFSGGVANNGTISAGGIGIAIGISPFTGVHVESVVSTFSGGISNGGVMIARTGIVVGLGVSTFSGGIGNSGTISVGNTGIALFAFSTFSGGISNGGKISSTNKSGILVDNVLTFTGGVNNVGTISAGQIGIDIYKISTFSDGINNGSVISATGTGIRIESVSSSFSGGVSNSGTISGGNGISIGSVAQFGTSTASGGVANSGTISVTAVGIIAGDVRTFSGNISNAGTITARTDLVIDPGVTFAAGSAIVNTGTLTGTGGTAIDASAATSPVIIDQAGGMIAGAIKLSANADQLNISGGSVAGNIIGSGSSDTLNFSMGGGTFSYGSAYGFTGIDQVNVNSGTVILDGTNSATNVDVFGGTLAGTGVLDPLLVTIHSGGAFAPGTPGVPGTSMTIDGNLAFQSGALYVVYLNPNTSSVATVTGTASLDGTVNASFASGSYLAKQYVILQSGGLSGAFSGLTTTNLPANFAASLDYTSDDVLLDLRAELGAGGALNQNQQSVANALDSYFNRGGTLPANFVSVFGMTDGALANALTQLDGEDATGAEHGAFDLMNAFLGLMLDPFVDGRGGPSTNSGALGFAPDQEAALPPDLALAYAGLLKAPPKPQTFDRRWTTWAAGFGGSAASNGDPLVGSNNVTTSTYGYAAGADYHVSPDTVLGFSLAGGGTNWTLANALGTGRSDAFLAGLYGVTHDGPWYLGAALAFANNWFTTNRTALGDQLTANFQGQSYAARLEGGYRLAVPVYHGLIGVTPYAALQAQNFHTPAYSEADLTGGGFGLSYSASNGTDTRSELGSRFDDLTALGHLPLILRGKVAWAHDWVGNPALNASFESLPGSSFTVFGAPIPHDSALTSAGAQLFFTPNWSLLAKFDGEFANGSQLYAGSGTLRYTW